MKDSANYRDSQGALERARGELGGGRPTSADAAARRAARAAPETAGWGGVRPATDARTYGAPTHSEGSAADGGDGTVLPTNDQKNETFSAFDTTYKNHNIEEKGEKGHKAIENVYIQKTYI